MCNPHQQLQAGRAAIDCIGTKHFLPTLALLLGKKPTGWIIYQTSLLDGKAPPELRRMRT
jgi:hypothetical protein